MDFMSAPSQEYGVLPSPLFLCRGMRSACKDQEFREKGQLWAHTGVQEKMERWKADLHTLGSFLYCSCRAKPGGKRCLNYTR